MKDENGIKLENEVDALAYVLFLRITKFKKYEEIKKILLQKKTSLESENVCIFNNLKILADFYEKNIEVDTKTDIFGHKEMSLRSFLDFLNEDNQKNFKLFLDGKLNI